MFRLQILSVVSLSFFIRKVFGLEVLTFNQVFSFIRFIPAPVSMRNLALLPSFRCNNIDSNFPVVIQLTLGMFPLDSLLFGILEVGFFLDFLMENFESSTSRLCIRFASTWNILISFVYLTVG